MIQGDEILSLFANQPEYSRLVDVISELLSVEGPSYSNLANLDRSSLLVYVAELLAILDRELNNNRLEDQNQNMTDMERNILVMEAYFLALCDYPDFYNLLQSYFFQLTDELRLKIFQLYVCLSILSSRLSCFINKNIFCFDKNILKLFLESLLINMFSEQDSMFSGYFNFIIESLSNSELSGQDFNTEGNTPNLISVFSAIYVLGNLQGLDLDYSSLQGLSDIRNLVSGNENAFLERVKTYYKNLTEADYSETEN